MHSLRKHGRDPIGLKRRGTHLREPEFASSVLQMWYDLNESNGGKVTNFDELADLWFRNLEEYATTGEVASGELPFAAQFFTEEWFPPSPDLPYYVDQSRFAREIGTSSCSFDSLIEIYCLLDDDGKPKG